jgi:hypothetical protein
MRVSVPLRRAYKLINHGPTTLITSAAGGRRNVMAAAWVMAVDYDPAKLVAVIAADTFTRTLIEQSGEFVVNVPTLKLIDVVYAAGQRSGEDDDKFAAYGLTTAGLDRRRAAHRGLRGVARVPRRSGAAHARPVRPLRRNVVAAWADDGSFRGTGVAIRAARKPHAASLSRARS